jgi:hypothetical protein
MEKVYVLKWIPTGELGAGYLSYEKAKDVAEKANKNKTWRHKMSEAMTGRPSKWMVVAVDIKDL